MNELNSWELEKSPIIHIEGKPVAISSLPKNIQFQIETFDKFKQEYANLLYEQDKLKSAIDGKNIYIQTLIKEFIKSKEISQENTNDIGKE